MPSWRTKLLAAGLTVPIVAVGIFILVLFLYDPSQNAFYPACLLHRATGLNCPGCGSLRAMHQLLHGNISAAFHFNPLLVGALPLAAWYAAWFAFRKLKHQPATFAIKPAWLWSGAMILVLFSVLRNLPYPAFAWLAPQ